MQISSGWLGQWAAKVWSLFTGHETKSSPINFESVVPGHLVPSLEQSVIAPRSVGVPFINRPSLVDSEAVQIKMPTPKAKVSRRLAAQIASQSRLNVRVGKKPRIARTVQAKSAVPRPVKIAAKVGHKPGHLCKPGKTKSTTIRSAFLPARHMVAKARLTQRALAQRALAQQSNVIPLPVTIKIGQPKSNTPTTKLPRLAA